MAQLSFENVGVLASVRQTLKSSEQVPNTIPIGVRTPLTLASGTLFAMNYTLKEQIADNLKNLILTNFGDRVGRPEMGTNLLPLLAEYKDIDSFNQEAMSRIKTSVGTWMRYVDLRGYEAFPQFENGIFINVIKIMLTYRVPQLAELAKQDSLLEIELRML